MPTIDLTADELAAVTAALRRVIENGRFRRAPRLDPLPAALAKFDAEPKLVHRHIQKIQGTTIPWARPPSEPPRFHRGLHKGGETPAAPSV
jgi:hypothetical protein